MSAKRCSAAKRALLFAIAAEVASPESLSSLRRGRPPAEFRFRREHRHEQLDIVIRTQKTECINCGDFHRLLWGLAEDSPHSARRGVASGS